VAAARWEIKLAFDLGQAVHDRRGGDVGKKTAGTKRHIVVDTIGILLLVLVTYASVRDRDDAKPLLAALRRAYGTIACPGPTEATPASERLAEHHEVMVKWAMAIVLTPRSARIAPE
jgi:hypothetical protein